MRCSGELPCKRCIEYGEECTWETTTGPNARVTQGFSARILRLEQAFLAAGHTLPPLTSGSLEADYEADADATDSPEQPPSSKASKLARSPPDAPADATMRDVLDGMLSLESRRYQSDPQGNLRFIGQTWSHQGMFVAGAETWCRRRDFLKLAPLRAHRGS